MSYFVYILYSQKLSKYYVGQTNDIESRLSRHNREGSPYTKKGVPWELKKVIQCDSRSCAVQLERSIKSQGIRRYLEKNQV